MSRRGKLIVLSGPGGVGKSTIVSKLIDNPSFYFSVSATTRKPRLGEIDGSSYHFIDDRSFDDLIDYLFRCQHFPVGAILSTGTGIVPPLDISLLAGDLVTITVDQIGTLVNKVVVVPEDINERIK